MGAHEVWDEMLKGDTPASSPSTAPDAHAVWDEMLRSEKPRAGAQVRISAHDVWDQMLNEKPKGPAPPPRVAPIDVRTTTFSELTAPNRPTGIWDFLHKWDPVGGYVQDVTDPEAKWWQKALNATIGAPMSAISRGVTTAAGLPRFSSPVEAINFLHSKGISMFPQHPVAGAWADFGVSLLGSMAIDPLTYTTFGAGPLAKAAAQLAKEAPEVAVASKAASEAMSAARGYRHAAALTPEFVQKGAQEMLRRTLLGTLPEDAAIVRKAVSPGGVIKAETPAARQAMQETLESAYGKDPKQYEALLDKYRKGGKVEIEKADQVTPRTIFDHTKKVEDRLDALARQQVALERRIHAERSGTRFGLPGTTGIRVGPSPLDLLGKMGSRPFGKWREIDALKDEVNVHGPDFGPAIERATDGKFNGSSSVGDVINNLMARQTGVRLDEALQKGTLGSTVIRNGVLTHGHLPTWLRRELAPFAAGDRSARLDDIQKEYELGIAALQKDPKALVGTKLQDLEAGVKTIQKLKADPKFMQEVGALPTGPGWLGHLTQTVQGLHNDLEAQITGAHFGFETAVAANDVAGSVKALEQLRNLDQAKVQRLFALHDAMVNAGIPYQVGAATRDFTTDILRSAKQIAYESNKHLDTLRTYMNDLSRPAISGLHVMASSGTDVWRAALKEMRQLQFQATGRIPTVPSIVTTDPGIAAVVMRAMDKKIDALLKKGTLDAAKAAEIRAFLIEVGKDPHTVGDLVYLLQSMQRATQHEMKMQKIMDVVTYPLQQYLRNADLSYLKTNEANLRQMAQKFQYEQAVYEPTRLGKFLQVMIRGIDDGVNAASRGVGIMRPITQAISRNEFLDDHAIDDAKRFGETWLRDEATPIVAKASGLKGNALQGAVMETVEGAYKWLKNQPDNLTDDVLKANHYNPTVILEIQDIGRRLRDEGMAVMKKIFKTDAAAGTFARNLMETTTDKFLDPMFSQEREAGYIMNYRPDYLPHRYRGDYSEQKRLNEILNEEEVNRLVMPKGVASEFFAPALARRFETTAELEHNLARVNEKIAVKRNELPLNLVVDHDMVAVLVQRRFLHNRVMANRQLLADLQTALPAHVLPFGRVRSPKQVGVLTGAGFKNLGDLNPYMKDWWVQGPIYDHLAKNAPKVSTTPLEWIGGRNMLFSFFNRYLNFFKRWNLISDTFHIKNIASLSLLARTPVKRAAEIAFEGIRGSAKYRTRWFSPWKATARAMEEQPIYQLGVRYGIGKFRRGELQRPVGDVVHQEMQPWGAWMKTPWQSIKGLQPEAVSPWSTFTFEVFDHSLKLAKFEQLLKAGLPPDMAAAATLHAMVDYRLAWMKPQVRTAGYAVFPFFAWKLGNWMIHIPHALEDPRWYAVLNHARDVSNEHFHNPDKSVMPTLLAHAFATPWQDPKTGYRQWIEPGLPWESMQGIGENVMKKDPQTGANAMVRHLINNSWYRALISGAYDFARQRQREKHTAVENLFQDVFGSETREGQIASTFWGFNAYADLYRMLTDENAWTNLGPNARRTAFETLFRVREAEMGPHRKYQVHYPKTPVQELLEKAGIIRP